MNLINSVMFSAIEVSNLLSFIAITLCLGAMLLFIIKIAVILRVQGDNVDGPIRPSSLTNHNNLQVPRLKMTRVHIPFTFRLLETGNNSYDEIRLAVSSQVPYTLQAFWAVSIRELHMSLWRPWTDLMESAKTINGGIVDAKHCQHLATDLRNQQPHNERIVTLKSPKPPLVLGAPPRLAYPLVVFLIRDGDSDEQRHPDDTVVLVNVVHLRDPVCPLPTSILAQYLKQASGQLSCLKQLYLATGDPLTADELTTSATSQQSLQSSSSTSGSGASSQLQPQPMGSLSLAEPVACAGNSGPLLCSDGPQTEQLCVVCHYFPLSRALLPCRHTCICAVCFSKLDRCPMCRAPITSYFCIRTEEYIPPNTIETRQPKTKGAVHWLDALNDRLTDFLGFR